MSGQLTSLRDALGPHDRSLLIECLIDWLADGFSSDEVKNADVRRLIVALGGEVPLRKYDRFIGRRD